MATSNKSTNNSPNRRTALAGLIGGSIAAGSLAFSRGGKATAAEPASGDGSKAQGVPNPIFPIGEFGAELTLGDRRFRRQFMRALHRLRWANRITQTEFVRMRRAAYSDLPIAAVMGGGGRPIVNDGKQEKAFIQHLRKGVEDAMGDKIPKGFFDDVLNQLPILDDVVTWILENWQLVAQIAMALLLILGTAEASDVDGKPEDFQSSDAAGNPYLPDARHVGYVPYAPAVTSQATSDDYDEAYLT